VISYWIALGFVIYYALKNAIGYFEECIWIPSTHLTMPKMKMHRMMYGMLLDMKRIQNI